MRKPSTTIRITEEAREILKEASASLGISQAAVMELALRQFWTSKLDDHLPKRPQQETHP